MAARCVRQMAGPPDRSRSRRVCPGWPSPFWRIASCLCPDGKEWSAGAVCGARCAVSGTVRGRPGRSLPLRSIEKRALRRHGDGRRDVPSLAMWHGKDGGGWGPRLRVGAGGARDDGWHAHCRHLRRAALLSGSGRLRGEVHRSAMAGVMDRLSGLRLRRPAVSGEGFCLVLRVHPPEHAGQVPRPPSSPSGQWAAVSRPVAHPREAGETGRTAPHRWRLDLPRRPPPWFCDCVDTDADR